MCRNTHMRMICVCICVNILTSLTLYEMHDDHLYFPVRFFVAFTFCRTSDRKLRISLAYCGE